jgi:hypothetical protein
VGQVLDSDKSQENLPASSLVHQEKDPEEWEKVEEVRSNVSVTMDPSVSTDNRFNLPVLLQLVNIH